MRRFLRPGSVPMCIGALSVTLFLGACLLHRSPNRSGLQKRIQGVSKPGTSVSPCRTPACPQDRMTDDEFRAWGGSPRWKEELSRQLAALPPERLQGENAAEAWAEVMGPINERVHWIHTQGH